MLMGRSQFYQGDFENAASTFAYMSRLFETQPAIYGRAKAWLAKCYIEQGWMYDAEDIIRNMQRDSIHWRAQKEWDYTYTDYYIHTQQFDKAIPYLRKVIKHEMRRKQKAREWYLMGQLQAALGRKTEAYKAFNDRNGGYLANGLENKDIYYMKHVYVGLVRCIDFLTSLPEWDGKNVAVQGGSQGGALAIIAAGLDSRVTQCVANHPALSDMAGYAAKGGTGGYPHFCRQPQILSNKDCLNTLAYFDVVNFARYVKAPTYLTWGYNDVTCPPTTSYAVWNTLKCTKESLLTPINEHWTTTETNRGQMEWIKAHLLK